MSIHKMYIDIVRQTNCVLCVFSMDIFTCGVHGVFVCEYEACAMGLSVNVGGEIGNRMSGVMSWRRCLRLYVGRSCFVFNARKGF